MRPLALRTAVLLIFLLGPLLVTPAAWGCSCAGTTSLVEEFTEADVVFAGTVTKVRRNWRYYYLPLIWYWPLNLTGFYVAPPDDYQARVYFEVRERFKGTDAESIAIASDLDEDGSCGIAWRVSMEAIVYAYSAPGAHPPLATNGCTRTMLVNEEELVALRSIAGHGE